MKRSIVGLCLLSSLGLCACSNSAQDGTGGSGGGSATGGIVASGGVTGSGGLASGRGTTGTGGSGAGITSGTGGTTVGGRSGSGGIVSTGGRPAGGTTGAQSAVCPYTVAVFSCESACKSLHAFSDRCGSDPTVPSEVQAMLTLYGQVEVVCTSTCAVVAPASQAQWKCFQGLPDDAPCEAIAGCDAINCP